MSLESGLRRAWYGPAWLSLPLWPLSLVFGALVAARRMLYRSGLLSRHRVSVPVVVVGNITVGGTGKTPVSAWIARQFGLRGHRVGIVMRGYGGSHSGPPRVVTADDDPAVVGDEALLHARRAPHVVVIGADRVAAAQLAAAQGAQVVVCDDGLQHLRLERDCEIAVVDAVRGLGNARLLPAGPLREPARRLDGVDAIVLTRREEGPEVTLDVRRPFLVSVRLEPGAAVNLVTGERRELDAFAGSTVHAVAGIGHPDAFFAALRAAGLGVEPHALPDHAALDPRALPFPRGATVLMTEKDAVKCREAAEPGWWFVEFDVTARRDSAHDLIALVLERTGLTGAGVHLG